MSRPLPIPPGSRRTPSAPTNPVVPTPAAAAASASMTAAASLPPALPPPPAVPMASVPTTPPATATARSAAAKAAASELAAPASAVAAGPDAAAAAVSGAPGRGHATRPRLSRKRAIVAAVGFMVTTGAAYFGFLRPPTAPAPEQVRAFAATLVNDDHLRFVSCQYQLVSSHAPLAHLSVDAVFETTEASYAPVDASAYLQQEFGWHATPSAIAKASPRALKRAGEPPPNPADVPLFRVVAPAGTTATYAAGVDAMRVGSAWELHAAGGHFKVPPPTGSARPPAGQYRVVSNPADRAQLEQLVAQQQAYITRLAEAEKQLAEETRQRREKAVAALKPGLLFAGFATQPEASTAWSLELTRVDPTFHRVTALLRNEDGWAHARRFDGQYTFIDDEVWLVLQTRVRDAIAGGGPVVDTPFDLQLKLKVEPDALAGTLSGGWELKAALLTPETRPSYVAELTAKDVAERRPGMTPSAPAPVTAKTPARTARRADAAAPGTTAAATAGAPETGPDARETAQAAGKMVRTVRDVRAAATSTSGSFFDRALAAASAALSAVPKAAKKAAAAPPAETQNAAETKPAETAAAETASADRAPE